MFLHTAITSVVFFLTLNQEPIFIQEKEGQILFYNSLRTSCFPYLDSLFINKSFPLYRPALSLSAALGF